MLRSWLKISWAKKSLSYTGTQDKGEIFKRVCFGSFKEMYGRRFHFLPNAFDGNNVKFIE